MDGFKNNYQAKSFWQRPEGVTGGIFLAAGVAGIAYLMFVFGAAIVSTLSSTLYLGITVMGIAALAYLVIDPKMRNLIGYMYQSAMRSITSLFVQIDPIGVLKNYLEDLRKNLRQMSKQIGVLRGQMRRLNVTIQKNKKDGEKSMRLAQRAKAAGKQSKMVLELRRIARLKDSNEKLETLYKKMEVISRVLKKMYDNSEILMEDLKDQVRLKDQERKAIRASHSAMRSAMNIISGNKDQRYMFDSAMEALATDVANKMGEMERFMDMSGTFIDSIDLQKGVFEDEGMKLLIEWEKKSDSLLLDAAKGDLLDNLNTNTNYDTLDLNEKPPMKEPEPMKKKDNNRYDGFFD